MAVQSATQYLTPRTVAQLSHEYELKDHLESAWSARPIELIHLRGQPILLLELPAGEALGLLSVPVTDIGRFLRLAVSLCEALGQLHENGLIHKDIKPANILVSSLVDRVWLTGFGLASRLDRERQPPASPELVAGTLAYMAPEQTGRMNRSIDSRSDLYSLGVTLYEMITGVLPFPAKDPMELIHCHIARQPVPPVERAPGLPRVVSDIVMKLLTKTAEHRYQTAGGIEHDLRACLAQWDVHERIDEFPLGQLDVPDRLRIPEKLYGRDREIEAMLCSFNRVIGGSPPELVLISGYSGIGKSSIVNELNRVLLPGRGLFTCGKFEQYRRDAPYYTLAQAFQGLIRPLLGKAEAELAIWRNELQEALGVNAGLIADLLPEITAIIGKPLSVPELRPQDAQRRWQLVFRKFISVFAKPDHPLVLFLDDLQWVDSATLSLLEDLLSARDLHYLVVIGAFRDNEVTVTHPLMRSLNTFRAKGAMQEINLSPLTIEQLLELVADSLHCSPDRAAPLAVLVHEKTGGNPFFAIQFLHVLADEGLLSFDRRCAAWSWDIEGIHAARHTDNVAELLAGKLAALPLETQRALGQLACLGNVADIERLSITLKKNEEQVHEALWEALRQQLIYRLDRFYKFAHDKVQEAAYALIPDKSRAEAHLMIGRIIAAHTPQDKWEDMIFEIVGHFNRGISLVSAQDERERIAKFNLIAGQRAKSSTAYVAALAYLVAGMDVLSGDCWQRSGDLMFALELNRAECELLLADFAFAEGRLLKLLHRVENLSHRASITRLLISTYIPTNRTDLATKACLDYLRSVEPNWSKPLSAAEIEAQFRDVWKEVEKREIEELADLPPMTDRECLATMDVLSSIVPPGILTSKNLYHRAVCQMIQLTLGKGNTDASCIAYVLWGMILQSHFGRYADGLRLGKLGLRLAERPGFDRFKVRVYLDFATVVNPWGGDLAEGIALLQRAFDRACEIGDMTAAAYSCFCLVTHNLAVGAKLDDIGKVIESGVHIVQRTGFDLVGDVLNGQLFLVNSLLGQTPNFSSFDQGNGNIEAVKCALQHGHLRSNASTSAVRCSYWIRKLQAGCFANDYDSAMEAASMAKYILWASSFPAGPPSLFARMSYGLELVEYHFYSALALAATKHSAAAEQLEILAAHFDQLDAWARNCPGNFKDRSELIAAEIARIEGRVLDAEQHFEQAISLAREAHFVHNEAIANETAARFYAARGLKTISHAHIRNARDCYLRWGAEAKVRQLEALHPFLRDWSPAHVSTSDTIAAPISHIDFETVIKVSQAVSGEIKLERLVDALMSLAIEHAGAERGVLLLSRENGLRHEAEAIIIGNDVAIRRRNETEAVIPESIINYVTRTREAILLNNASDHPTFNADPYICERAAKSVLCLPLVHESKLTGVLYLENNLAPSVFTPKRTAVLKLLALQAAISLENSYLYSDLAERENKIRRLIDANIIGTFIWKTTKRWDGVSDCLIVEANDALLQIVGYERADVAAGRLSRLTISPPEWEERDAQRLREVRMTGTVQPFEKEYVRKDGSRVPVLMGFATFDERRDQGFAFVIDLTDVKRTEAALRRSEAFLEKAQQLSLTGGFSCHSASGEFTWSAELYRIFEFDSDLRVTLPLIETRCHPEDIHWMTELRASLERGDSDFDYEHRLMMPNGTIKYVRVVAQGAPDTERGGVEYFGAVQDLTQRRLAEAALEKARSELAHVSRIMSLGALTASIAHEINQPLAGIIANASTCLRMLNSDSPNVTGARETAKRTIRDANRAAEIITRLRALFSKREKSTETVNLNQVSREVISLSLRELQERRVVPQLQLADDLPPVRGDRIQLQQVIMNLVRNAADALRDVDNQPRQVIVRTAKLGSEGVLLAVQDSGPGIDPASFDRLFDAFYTTKADGLGVGLAICQRIIEAHGGKLWAGAASPHGAVFQFSLPRAGDAENLSPA